jgi:hypothetical protein
MLSLPDFRHSSTELPSLNPVGASRSRIASGALKSNAERSGRAPFERENGKPHALASIARKDLLRIRLKKSVFTPAQQLIKPAITGAGSGLALAIILRIVNARVTGSGILPLALFVAFLCVFVNLNKVVWSHLIVRRGQ